MISDNNYNFSQHKNRSLAELKQRSTSPLSRNDELIVNKMAKIRQREAGIWITDHNRQEGFRQSNRELLLSRGIFPDFLVQDIRNHGDIILEFDGISQFKEHCKPYGLVVEPTCFLEIQEVTKPLVITVQDKSCDWRFTPLHKPAFEIKHVFSAMRAVKISMECSELKPCDFMYGEPDPHSLPPSTPAIAQHASTTAAEETIKSIFPFTALLASGMALAVISAMKAVSIVAATVPVIDPMIIARLDTHFNKPGRVALYFSICRWM
jgi:hypothetical protein